MPRSGGSGHEQFGAGLLAPLSGGHGVSPLTLTLPPTPTPTPTPTLTLTLTLTLSPTTLTGADTGGAAQAQDLRYAACRLVEVSSK